MTLSHTYIFCVYITVKYWERCGVPNHWHFDCNIWWCYGCTQIPWNELLLNDIYMYVCIYIYIYVYQKLLLSLESVDYHSRCVHSGFVSIAVNGVSVQILSVWCLCPLWLHAGPFNSGYSISSRYTGPMGCYLPNSTAMIIKPID